MPRARRAVALLALAPVLAPLWSCGGRNDPVVLVHGITFPVEVVDNAFRPATTSVAAGTEVVWSNAGHNGHNVQPVNGRGWGVTADAFAAGDRYSFRFTKPGTYAYYCSLHGTTTKGMVGTIVVTG